MIIAGLIIYIIGFLFVCLMIGTFDDGLQGHAVTLYYAFLWPAFGIFVIYVITSEALYDWRNRK